MWECGRGRRSFSFGRLGTASGDRVVAGSEKLIFRLGNQTAATDHQGGALDFGKDGKLYIATGDNGRDPVNEPVAQQHTNLFGKMLRINKNGTIPTKNPFYSTASGNNRAIWALGLRNPFKFAVKPDTGKIYINDVGEDTWEEINQLQKGANFGWPFCEGAHDYAGTPGEANCEAPPPYTPPIYEYPHEGDPLDSGCSITGGTFYNPTTIQFPRRYVGDYFFADFCSGWIRTREPTTGEVRGFATGIERPIDLEVSQAGELYYLARGSTGSPASVGKIEYVGI